MTNAKRAEDDIISEDEMRDFIENMPKFELHLHIEGSLEPELMFELSQRNNIDIPFKSVEEVRQAYDFTNLKAHNQVG